MHLFTLILKEMKLLKEDPNNYNIMWDDTKNNSTKQPGGLFGFTHLHLHVEWFLVLEVHPSTERQSWWSSHVGHRERNVLRLSKKSCSLSFEIVDDLKISDTICEVGKFEALEKLSVDEPTINMMIQVNDSPFAGQEGKLVTSRSIRERLDQELKTNVALRVEDTDNPDKFRISGRGELHLSILIENMRREGFEMGVSSPEVITKVIDNVKNEPFENLTIDIEAIHQGKIMEKLGERKAQLIDMVPDSKGRVRIDYIIASRGLIGFRTEFLTLTSGSGLMYHTFDKYRPVIEGLHTGRRNGALISIGQGKALPYALFNLQDRGKMIIKSGIEVYEGMIIGIHSRNNDLVVNPLKGKQLTNVRASGNDDAVLLTTPINVTLEFALEFINDDELIEVTPISLRIRKKFLKEHERKKAARAAS